MLEFLLWLVNSNDANRGFRIMEWIKKSLNLVRINLEEVFVAVFVENCLEFSSGRFCDGFVELSHTWHQVFSAVWRVELQWRVLQGKITVKKTTTLLKLPSRSLQNAEETTGGRRRRVLTRKIRQTGIPSRTTPTRIGRVSTKEAILHADKIFQTIRN